MQYPRDIRGQNLFALDVNLQRTLARIAPEAAARWSGHLSDFGAWVGGEVDTEAEYTDRHGRPALEAFDRNGDLVNRIRVNPLWEAASRGAYERGVVGLNYIDDPAPFAVTFAMGYILAQADISLHCPVTMTGAVAYVLDRFAPAPVKETYLHHLTRMDGGALSGGTWATELHGGSDVGATTTVARKDGEHFRLDGLKWFTSNPDGGLAVATARPEGAAEGSDGLGLYLVPARLEDGSPNRFRIRRLKDKLGTCGIATGEIDLTGTWALEVAPPPDGIRVMMEALEFSRLHNAMAAIGLQRRAFLEAVAYASRRRAFGHVITEYPMVQDEILNLLAGLEAGCALAFEAVRAFDRATAGDGGRPWMRLVTALAKHHTAEQANVACRAAMEIMGGNAYTYDHVTPRLVCDAQVLTIWEGPANIQALEMLRLLGNRYPGYEAFTGRIDGILGAAPEGLGPLAAVVDNAYGACREAVAYVQGDAREAERHARKLLGLMADTLAAGLLLEEAGEAHAAGDGRKALVARLFAERHLAPPARRGIGPGADWAQRHFDALAGYQAVAPSAVGLPA
ncbi:MAG: acyl-CoA dehydrogenase family protein [Rhodospirillales bacterium]